MFSTSRSVANRLLKATRGARRLQQPIFVVGCAKSGTSALGLILQDHPDVGPKNPHARRFSSLQDFLNAMLSDPFFDVVAHEMEEKALWDSFFPIRDVPLRIGPELILFHSNLQPRDRARLLLELTKNFRQKRFLSKQPFNTFRIHVLRELFPDAKIVAIHRDGTDVVASWGRKQGRWKGFGGYARAIPFLADKWTSAVRHIETYKDALGLYLLRYEDLVSNPEHTLRGVLEFCELEICPKRFAGLRLEDRRGSWRTRVPKEFHDLLLKTTRHGRELLGYA